MQIRWMLSVQLHRTHHDLAPVRYFRNARGRAKMMIIGDGNSQYLWLDLYKPGNLRESIASRIWLGLRFLVLLPTTGMIVGWDPP